VNEAARGNALLVLDLDECLIYGSESQLERAADFRVGPFHVYRRPHLCEFLQGVATWYQLAIWSSGTSDYVGEIAREICPHGLAWRFVWARDRCIQRLDPETMAINYLKDLKKVVRLGYALERILFVDDSPEKLSRNYGNAVYVKPFEGAADDAELPLLLKYLESIHEIQSFRTLEKRGWRSKIGGARSQ
jgi:RNA polymerase II subunit A small phosphatase-like protein